MADSKVKGLPTKPVNNVSGKGEINPKKSGKK